MQASTELLGIGVSLHAHGINNWALSREQVLQLLPELEQREVSVLGGDVCEIIEHKPTLNGDSWYCDREVGETPYAYAKRSLDKTRQYVEAYASPRGFPNLFILVLALQS